MSRTNVVRLMHDVDDYGTAWVEFTTEQKEADASFHKFGGNCWRDG